MPFYLPPVDPGIQAWKDQANDLPAPEGGGHILDAVAKFLVPQLARTWGRWVEGKYEDQPWQTIAADAFVPDKGWGSDMVGALGMPVAMGMAKLPEADLLKALIDAYKTDLRTAGGVSRIDISKTWNRMKELMSAEEFQNMLKSLQKEGKAELTPHSLSGGGYAGLSDAQKEVYFKHGYGKGTIGFWKPLEPKPPPEFDPLKWSLD